MSQFRAARRTGESPVTTETSIPVAPIAIEPKQGLLGRCTAVSVYVFQKIMPEPYVFALLLTFAAVGLAMLFAPRGSPVAIAEAWYGGVFNIFTFAFQMVIMLVAGYALATAPQVHKLLIKLASVANGPSSAISLIVFTSLIASWLNWSLGLVTAALLARELAKRVRVDFGYLVAAGYTGFVVSTEGLSGSIALSQATPGSALNMVEKFSGHGMPLTQTVFTRFNLIPCAVLLIALPVIFRYLAPTEVNSSYADPEKLRTEDEQQPSLKSADTFGGKLDNAWILTVLMAAFGIGALILEFSRTHGRVDLNLVITALVMLGMLLHWRPARYLNAVKKSARVTGSLILQYPLYGGIMGIITTTGLAAVISNIFIHYSTARTLPFFTSACAAMITFFVPSGGGLWAVVGPLVIPAAQHLHASLAGTTMAVSMGESAANMMQPFWALPILAIAGISMKRMMGFMVVTFLVSYTVFAASLLLLAPYYP